NNPNCNYDSYECPEITDPVCGTDGITYSNECMICMKNRKHRIPVLIREHGPCKRGRF
uniref:Kazal-like domain-containing protein n=1 Tax=Castor canadensis TaxID=51338 RepID=A0A8C0W9A6_CASCN